MNDTPQKRCSGPCKQILPATPEFFSRNRSKKDGFGTECKVCMREYKKQYFQTHKDKITEKNKEYCGGHKEQKRIYYKQYNENRKEQQREYDKQRYETHKDQI